MGVSRAEGNPVHAFKQLGLITEDRWSHDSFRLQITQGTIYIEFDFLRTGGHYTSYKISINQSKNK